MQPEYFSSVPLEKSYRLLNHGPTVLVSANHGGISNVMSAAWACVLDFGQSPKVTVVLDKATYTRELLIGSGEFALQLPTKAMVTRVRHQNHKFPVFWEAVSMKSMSYDVI
jgi:flavin reductase (DIM6/NTAB) family NADH-FMN oxidoreductase RutF